MFVGGIKRIGMVLLCFNEEWSVSLQLLETRSVLVAKSLSSSERNVVRDTLEAVTGFPYEMIQTDAQIRGMPLSQKFILAQGLELGSDALDILAAALDNESEDSETGVLCLASKNTIKEKETALLNAAAAAYIRHYGLIEALPHVEPSLEKVEKVEHIFLDAEERNHRLDLSELVVVDGLIDEEARSKVRKECFGFSKKFPTSSWARGGLADTTRAGSEGDCWGLREDAIDYLCESPAVKEIENRVIAWLQSANRQCAITRMPAAVLGDEVSPVTANAPVCGDSFGYHIDADPYLLPPSPWRDFFGLYVNRDPHRPRFVSALIYLSEAPFGQPRLGASTQFLDTPTGKTLEVMPRPGRLVLLDQDITHSVIPPTEAAGPNSPRFSLVFKLVIHPGYTTGHPLLTTKAKRKTHTKKNNNDAGSLDGTVNLLPPELAAQNTPILLGSAAAAAASSGDDIFHTATISNDDNLVIL